MSVRINSKRIYIRRLEMDDLHLLLDLRVRNREFFQPFEPLTPDSHYTIEGHREILEKIQSNWENRSGYGFGIFLNSNCQLIGRVNLSNVVRGAWESCTMGYFLDEIYNGQGFTTEAVHLAIGFAFGPAELHRVQAAAMPRNVGSIQVLEKVGFRYDGFSEYYLKINGIWEHHNLYSITREHWNE
jgi:ribosomal-protein-alanine N-acetyltransferase